MRNVFKFLLLLLSWLIGASLFLSLFILPREDESATESITRNRVILYFVLPGILLWLCLNYFVNKGRASKEFKKLYEENIDKSMGYIFVISLFGGIALIVGLIIYKIFINHRF